MRQLAVALALGLVFACSPALAFAQEDKPSAEKDSNYKLAHENWDRLIEALNGVATILPENTPMMLAYWTVLADTGAVWNEEETKQLDEMGALYMLYWRYGEHCLALLTDSGDTAEFLANLARPQYVAKVERYIATAKQLATVVLLKINELKTKLKQSPRVDQWEKEGDKRWAESAPLTEAEPSSENEKK